jgi:uncharacterized protein DUF5343
MTVTTDSPAPYAPGSVIINLIERHRNRGLPSPVNADVLERASVSTSLIPRTFQALQTLDLINEEGVPTDIFEGIRRAPQSEYQARLADWMRSTYSEVFSYVDPATDDETAVRDAFRGYHPVGQQGRMVSLFLTLCGAAGLAPEKPTKPRAGSRWGAPNPTSVTPRVIGKKPAKAAKPSQRPIKNLPAALAGLLESLPAEGEGWSKERRDGFVGTFGHVIDFCFPIITEKEDGEE